MKLDYPVTSLARTFDCVKWNVDILTFERLLLKPTERKILLYISGELV